MNPWNPALSWNIESRLAEEMAAADAARITKSPLTAAGLPLAPYEIIALRK